MMAAGSAQTVLPSLSKQKSFIVENAGILNRETKLAILRIVMQEVGDEAVMENSGTKEVDINLDICASANEDVVRHVYNMVRARLDSLNQPVGRNVDPQRGRADAADTLSADTDREPPPGPIGLCSEAPKACTPKPSEGAKVTAPAIAARLKAATTKAAAPTKTQLKK
jgi:hypothetical protein